VGPTQETTTTEIQLQTIKQIQQQLHHPHLHTSLPRTTKINKMAKVQKIKKRKRKSLKYDVSNSNEKKLKKPALLMLKTFKNSKKINE
jgi:hypothetical protein